MAFSPLHPLSFDKQGSHQPLHYPDSIRILELNGFDPSQGQLYGLLIPARLSEHHNYSALSYAWGDGLASRSISLAEDHSHPISETLFSGLKELLSGGNKVYVWVDQICIYSGRYRAKTSRNLKVAPLFCESFGFRI
jgi:Heterokaryon incompatibility protein (HET)